MPGTDRWESFERELGAGTALHFAALQVQLPFDSTTACFFDVDCVERRGFVIENIFMAIESYICTVLIKYTGYYVIFVLHVSV